MPTLNIKDPEVHRMTQELAARRHTTATGAVRDALAKAYDEPLLFKGDDFTHTDVRSLLP